MRSRMRKWWPLLFAALLLFLKVALDSLADNFIWSSLPGDITFSVLSYDVWALTEELSGSQIINVSDRTGSAWLVLFVLCHLLFYILYLLLHHSWSFLENYYFIASLMTGVFMYSEPVLIALEIPFWT
jgi:hypothetical protein